MNTRESTNQVNGLMARHDRRWRGATIGVIALLVASLGGGVALAKSKKREEARAQQLEEVSQESATAMHDIRAARWALMEGRTKAAKAFLSSAKQNLKKAEKNAPRTKITISAEETMNGKKLSAAESSETTDLVTIDSWLGLAEDFVATADNQHTLQTAHAQIAAGDNDKAIETLRAADIDVSMTRILMPVAATERRVEAAASQLDSGAYYEANLTLLDAEKGLVADTVLVHEPIAPDGSSAS